ncbi:hypothetical protein P4S57_16040 [Pseudoalteromonas sp. Hal273]
MSRYKSKITQNILKEYDIDFVVNDILVQGLNSFLNGNETLLESIRKRCMSLYNNSIYNEIINKVNLNKSDECFVNFKKLILFFKSYSNKSKVIKYDLVIKPFDVIHPLIKDIENIIKPHNRFFKNYFFHGSAADGKTTDYSDIDDFIIINHDELKSRSDLLILKKILRKLTFYIIHLIHYNTMDILFILT